MTRIRFYLTSATCPSNPPQHLAAAAITLALLATCGCGTKIIEPDVEPVHPVRGKVMWQGKPAVNALVRFHPTGGGRVSAAKTMKDGTFQLTTFTANDGAPPGRYVVTITMRDKDADGESTNVLPAKYAKPDTSDLHVDVKPGSNELQPFVLRG